MFYNKHILHYVFPTRCYEETTKQLITFTINIEKIKYPKVLPPQVHSEMTSRYL